MGLFKIKYCDSDLITDSNSAFVSKLTGSDLNVGSRAFPFSTITKGYSTSKKYIIVADADYNESIILNLTPIVIAANGLGGVKFSTYTDASSGNSISEIRYLNLFSLFTQYNRISNCILGILSGNSGVLANSYIKFNFIETIKLTSYESTSQIVTNNSILNFYNYIINPNGIIRNSIISTVIDLYNYSSRNNTSYIPIFKYCLFRKASIWKWNGAIIPINYGTYGNVAGDYMSDVISGLYAYASAMTAGTDKTYFLAMIPTANSSNIFYVDANGKTCKVIEDRPSIAGSIQIFNRYVADVPVDYSLFLSPLNPALIMSDQMSYVGCYKANAKVLTFGTVVNVNSDGTDDLVTPPDMLINDGNGKFHVSTADSVQTRNRVRSDVFNFKRGFNLTEFQSQIKSGLASRFSLGKFQPYNVTDAPTLPMESLEVNPYDTLTTPSAYPRFSANFNGPCQIWYKTSDNTPLLFSELAGYGITTDKSLMEYGAYAVSNADFETYALSSTVGVSLKNAPVYFAQIEINLNYYV